MDHGPAFERWEDWVADQVRGLNGDRGAGAWSALCALKARLAAGGLRTDELANVHRAIARMSWMLAAWGGCEGLPADEDLLRAATTSADLGAVPRDIVLVYSLLADEVGRAGRLVEKRELLEHAARVPGPERATPSLALARRSLVDQADYWAVLQLVNEAETALAEGTPDPGKQVDLFDTRARANLGLGLLDLAAVDVARAVEIVEREPTVERYRPRVALLRLQFAFTAEDYESVVEMAPNVLAMDKPLLPAEIRRFLALARWRLSAVPLSRAQPILPLVEEAIAIADEDGDADVGIRARIAAATLLAEIGERTQARARLDQARTIFASHADLARNLWLRAQLAVLRAYFAVSDRDTPELGALRQELAAIAHDLTELWRQVPPRPDGIGFLNLPERRNVFSALVSVERALDPDRPDRALAHVLRPQLEGSLARRLALPAVTVEELQRELVPQDGGLLLFLPAFAGSHVFAVTRDRVLHCPLPRHDAVRRDVLDLRRRLLDESGGDRALHELRELGQRIRTCLLPDPIAEAVRSWRSCGVVGRDLLYDLPFEALPGFVDSWLGVEKALWYLPSVPLAAHCRRRAPPRPAVPRVVLLAATDGEANGSAPRLPIPAEHLHDLVRTWDGARVLCGAEVDRGVLRRGGVVASDLLQILAHGTRDVVTTGGVPSSGFHVRDGVISSADVEALAGGTSGCPPLIVLSICGSAHGSPRRGEDTGSHVAGAFLRAGAVAVVAADTDIRVPAAMAFAASLHEALAAGLPVAHALQAARRDLAGQKSFAHPCHHAVMAVWGWGGLATRSVGAVREERSWLLLAGVAGAATVTVWWALRLLSLVRSGADRTGAAE